MTGKDLPTYSIGRTLFQILLFGILVPAGLIWALGHVTARSAVTSLWNSLSKEIADHAVERTLRYLETGATAVSYNTSLLGQGMTDPKSRRAMLEYLRAGLIANPNVTWYSFGGADGAYLSAYRPPGGGTRITWREQEGGAARYRDFLVEADGLWTALPEKVKKYDPRQRVWYTRAIESEIPVWSEPFLFASGPPGFILSARAVDPNGRTVGVWGIEYEMTYVSTFLRSQKVGRQGRAYLVTGSGEVIGHPLATIGKPDGFIVIERGDNKAIAVAQGHRDGWLRESFAATESSTHEEVRGRFEHDGQTILYAARSFPKDSGLDWRVIVVVPEEDILGEVHGNELYAALAAAGIAACFLTLGTLISRQRLSHPLSDIAEDLKDMSRLETGHQPRIDESRISEVAGMVEAREVLRKGLRSFERYVPADLVRSLMRAGTEAQLGGEQRVLTVMFVDVADFSRISEQIRDPGRLVHALSEYLDVASVAIADHGGTVDKYIGDAIMAFWGAPKELPEHTLRACEAAWTLQRLLTGLRIRLEVEGQPLFHARIGINTGEVLVGNIGSAERMNYTVMGDVVNLASRLEGLCKIYGLEIAVGQATWMSVKPHFEGRPVDCVAVKGKLEAAIFYELIGRRGETDAPDAAFAATYTDAFEKYRIRAFEAALVAFEAAAKLRPDDVSTQILTQRCQHYILDPPPPDWTGAVPISAKR